MNGESPWLSKRSPVTQWPGFWPVPHLRWPQVPALTDEAAQSAHCVPKVCFYTVTGSFPRTLVSVASSKTKIVWFGFKVVHPLSHLRAHRQKPGRIGLRCRMEGKGEECSVQSLALDFPGGPVVNTLHSQCRGQVFDLWLGKILHTMGPKMKQHKAQPRSSLHCSSDWSSVIVI